MLFIKKAVAWSGCRRYRPVSFYYGFLVASTFGVIFNLVLPAFGNYRLIWIGPLFTTSFTVSVGYSIHSPSNVRY